MKQKTQKIQILKVPDWRLLVLGWVLVAASSINAQRFERVHYEVVQNGELIKFPWTGGLNAPQFSQADLDFDGDDDLFIFDRVGDVSMVLTSLKKQGDSLAYGFAPEIANRVPLALEQWALLRDFNGDNIPDLFARTLHPGIHGVDVYRGSDVGGALRFERMRFDFGEEDFIYFEISNLYTALYASWLDISVFEDIDGDSDLDILSFDPGGSTVQFYKNTSIEQGLGLDTLVFDLEDNCWGKFKENPFNQNINLSNDPEQCGAGGEPPLQPRHSGSTLAVYDADNDADMDILIGDIGSSHIIQLTNGGSADQAFMTSQITQFPEGGAAVDIPFFPAPFFIDINHDGKDDLLFSTNEEAFVSNRSSVWYYQNVGTQEAPQYSLQTKDYLLSEMLDFGTGSRPTFVDENADGLMDIVVGTAGYYDNGLRDPRLILLRNTGTATEPAFEVTDDDYLGFSQFANAPSWDFAPTFGDLDSDGDKDLLVGEQNGQLYYAENLAGPGQPSTFGEIQYPFEAISVGTASTPCIYDVNGDGLNDLVIGERVGNNNTEGMRCSNLNYFQNVGTPMNPDFIADPATSPNDNCFGNVLFNTIPALKEYSSPALVPTNDGLMLLTGREQGPIRQYLVSGDISAEFALIHDSLGMVKEGFRTAPALADIDADGLFEMVVGNLRGGLAMYETDLEVLTTAINEEMASSPEISLYPNPAQSVINLRLEFNAPGSEARISIAGPLGQMLYENKLGDGRLSIPISDYPAGLYWLISEIDGKRSARSFVVVR